MSEVIIYSTAFTKDVQLVATFTKTIQVSFSITKLLTLNIIFSKAVPFVSKLGDKQ